MQIKFIYCDLSISLIWWCFLKYLMSYILSLWWNWIVNGTSLSKMSWRQNFIRVLWFTNKGLVKRILYTIIILIIVYRRTLVGLTICFLKDFCFPWLDMCYLKWRLIFNWLISFAIQSSKFIKFNWQISWL